jgi:hypothetical protein
VLLFILAANIHCFPSNNARVGNIAKKSETEIVYLLTKNMKKLIDEYITRTRKWKQADYQIKFIKSDGDIETFSIIYKDDLAGTTLGGGKSFELHVNKVNMSVVKEYAYQ